MWVAVTEYVKPKDKVLTQICEVRDPDKEQKPSLEVTVFLRFPKEMKMVMPNYLLAAS